MSPETVVRWHRSGALYWRTISGVRRIAGRPRISKEVRDLIFRMVAENPTWSAPRLYGELLMVGFDVSERTISRWMRRAPRDPEPGKRLLAFLGNHREAIAAMDFFTVPTLTLRVLYCFFVIGHSRRRILHFNVTCHPSAAWIIQQLREAFPLSAGPRYRSEREPLEAVALRLCPLLPPGPDASWPQQGNAGRSSSLSRPRCGSVSSAPGRLAPSLRSSCLIIGRATGERTVDRRVGVRATPQPSRRFKFLRSFHCTPIVT